jgi:Transposase DDE domain group 1
LRVQATNSPGSFEVTTDGTGVVGHAGAALLRDLAVVLADGGDCLSDLAVLRNQPELFGPVPPPRPPGGRSSAPPPTLTGWLGYVPPGHARARAWAAGGQPDVEVLVVDADATLVLAHTDAKEGAAGTYKGSFGFCPLLAYLDRGPAPGEPLAGVLGAGNAAPGAAADLVELADLALAQLPASDLPVVVRSDSAGGSSKLAWHLRERGVGFTLGMQVDAHVREAILAQPEHAWTPAVEPDGQVRDRAEVCELTGWVEVGNWPEGTRVLCRREDAHPGAQLRFTDHEGHRFQVFLTDQADPDIAALELRHRQRARVEDRIRAAKARGLRNLPFDLVRRNAVWLELVLCAQTSPAGRRRCCWTARWRSPSPRRRAIGCCMSPPASSATPAG